MHSRSWFGWTLPWRSTDPATWVRRLADVAWSNSVYLRLDRPLCNREEFSEGVTTKGSGSYRVIARSLGQLKVWRSERIGCDGWLPWECFLDSYAGLELVYTVWNGSELAHLCWVARQGQKTSLPRIQVPEGEAEVRGAYTFPRYRNRGLFRLALARLLNDLVREGVQRVFAHVRPENTPSMNAFCQLGFEPRAVCEVVCRLGWRRVRFRDPQGQGLYPASACQKEH
jgi:ribosomal protein S18 acetylase RimI-like enzyme